MCTDIYATNNENMSENGWTLLRYIENILEWSWRTDVVHIDTCVIISAGLVQCAVHAVSTTEKLRRRKILS